MRSRSRLLAALVIAVAACSPAASQAPSASTPAASQEAPTAAASASAEASVDPVVAAAQAAVASGTGPPATWPGPTESVTGIPTGKKITVISCSEASSCHTGAQAAVDAATALGWTANIVDGKGDPATYSAAIRNAVVNRVDGIVNIAIPPGLVQDALRFAKEQNVPVIDAAGVPTTDPLISGQIPLGWERSGRLMGDFIIADSDGKAKVVVFRDDEFPGIKIRMDSLVDQLGKCQGCEVLEEIPLTINEVVSPAMGEHVTNVVNRFGRDLEYLVTTFDAAEAFSIPALQSTGAIEYVKDVGFAGAEQQTSQCNQGLVHAIIADLDVFEGWQGVDDLARIFVGQEVQELTVPNYLVTPDECPATGNAQSLYKVDIGAEYKKLWGV